jgi:hypothetical protein
MGGRCALEGDNQTKQHEAEIHRQLQVFPPSSDFGATSRDAGLLLHAVRLRRAATRQGSGRWRLP